jgi:LysR family transcriptional regulator for metE and metH
MPAPTLPMRLELRDFRLVAAIADTGNLTRAGEHLHLTQPALSRQLADLERRVGSALFERSGRRMVPTRLGEHLLGRARLTLDQMREVETDLTQMVGGREIALRIATECYTVYHWLPAVLASYRDDHPTVDVQVVAQSSKEPIPALIAGALDLCIISSETRDRRVMTTRLFDDELVAVVSAQHALAERRTVKPEQLARERFLLYTPPEENVAYRSILAPAGVTPRQLSVIQLTEAIVELVRANLGVSILARWAIEPYLGAGDLRVIRIAHPAVRRTWKAAIRSQRDVPAYLSDFVRFMRRSIRLPDRAQSSGD